MAAARTNFEAENNIEEDQADGGAALEGKGGAR